MTEDGTRDRPAEAGRAGRWYPRVRWTPALKRAFLDELAASCDVRRSAAAVGVAVSSLYERRRKDPAFAEAWSQAVRLGYELLETQLIGHALAGGGPAFEGAGGPVDVDLGLRLLAMHGANRGRPGNRNVGPPPRRLSRHELEAVLLRKLELVERGLSSSQQPPAERS